jgi:hypothetical protein
LRFYLYVYTNNELYIFLTSDAFDKKKHKIKICTKELQERKVSGGKKRQPTHKQGILKIYLLPICGDFLCSFCKLGFLVFVVKSGSRQKIQKLRARARVCNGHPVYISMPCTVRYVFIALNALSTPICFTAVRTRLHLRFTMRELRWPGCLAGGVIWYTEGPLALAPAPGPAAKSGSRCACARSCCDSMALYSGAPSTGTVSTMGL